MQFKLSNLTFALFAFAVTTGVNASPVTPADGLPGGIVSSEQLDHWLATTDAKLTFIGDPAGVNGRLNPLASRQGPGVLATRVVYCSTRSHNVCGGACTVYNGGAACLNAPGTQCLTADRNVAFCDRASVPHLATENACPAPTMSSRTDLLAWLNELLQINYTKIEQCGSGGAYCQIMDSIYGDVPMNRVKMNSKHEYEYVANYKVLQNVFKAKRIDKPVPVEKLVKCKMQDNLEFLQWVKKFWEANYGGAGYDAVARRKGAALEPPATPRSTPGTPAGGNKAEGLEKEREFYFQKLREIEILVQEFTEEKEESEVFSKIKKILYSTEDGFEGGGAADETF
ncbi:hypothetical protein EST38_g7313 [Candolleomyces aberdarensis]|uniref:Uncharacterized protein n=1 Tax=Candolleomyces aberdarensis TaxID=2316362 RepID=A0A4Q2DHG0_9AGAR|nr:hypothetical protein EST38_g7313 [Candolleomyces aberdarensis]